MKGNLIRIVHIPAVELLKNRYVMPLLSSSHWTLSYTLILWISASGLWPSYLNIFKVTQLVLMCSLDWRLVCQSCSKNELSFIFCKFIIRNEKKLKILKFSITFTIKWNFKWWVFQYSLVQIEDFLILDFSLKIFSSVSKCYFLIIVSNSSVGGFH